MNPESYIARRAREIREAKAASSTPTSPISPAPRKLRTKLKRRPVKTVEVEKKPLLIPQLIQCGTFVEGATPAERIVAAGRRIRQERAAMLAADTAALEAGAGLALLCVFRAENFLPDRDALELGRRVARVAKAYAVQPRLMFIRGQKNNPVKVWPRAILRQAADSLIPRLPFYPEGGRAS